MDALAQRAKRSPRFSVITVCYNALSVLPGTVASLKSQACSDYEWVVVDGGSSDGSAQWLAEQAPDVLLSERDAGIYDAMNKAVRLACGEFVFFLNADDRFADAQVLADVDAALSRAPRADLVYGSAVYASAQARSRQTYRHLTPRNLPFANLCHQAVFARRSLFDRFGPFDMGYPIIADLVWLVVVFRSGAVRLCIDRDICVFATGGMHEKHSAQLQAERRRMHQELLGARLPWLGAFQYRIARRLRMVLERV